MTYDGETYYYITNMQGDVVGMLDDTGAKLITYNYTAYGQGYITANETEMTATISAVNPLLYRGYVLDIGTGLYYCQTRYYDPAIGRFLNADTYPATGQGLTGNNMFAYCGNNPVNREDACGEWFNFVIGAVVGAVVGGVTAAISSYKETGSVNVASVVLGATTGAIGGLIGASGVPAVGQAVASGLMSAANNVGNSLIKGEKINWGDVAVDAAIGAVSSGIGSLATKNAAKAAKGTIAKGIKRVVSGKSRYDSGSRYWKGAMKRGMDMISRGVKDLNFAQGASSVIGSEAGGIFSLAKTIFKR